MGNHSVLGKTRRRQDQPLTCGVGGVGRLHIYSMADSIRVIKGRTCNLFYGLICIIFRVSLTIKCKCSLHSHMCMGKLKCCTSPPSDSWGRVSLPPGQGVEETYDISDYSKGDIEKEEGNSFSILHLACMSSLLYFAGSVPWQFLLSFFWNHYPSSQSGKSYHRRNLNN